MSGTNVGSGNLSVNLGYHQGNPIGGTSIGMDTNPTLLRYMVGFRLHDFSHLINDPLLHNSNWPLMTTKLPFEIPKFEGNPREELTNHVHSFVMRSS